MADINTIGWVVELMRASHLDDASAPAVHWFAVNLVAPQASEANWPDQEPDEDNERFPVAQTQPYTDLLRPWHWTSVSWKLYGWSGNAWVACNSAAFAEETPQLEETTDVKNLREAFDIELDRRTSACANAFSLNDDRWHGHPDPARPGWVIEQSLVHATASLAHSPAMLSNRVFCCAGFITISAAEYSTMGGDAGVFVAFPSMELDKVLYTPTTPVHTVNNGVEQAAYTPDLPTGKKIVFRCEAAAGNTPTLDPASFTIHRGNRRREALEHAFVTRALPSQFLSRALGVIEFSATGPDAGLYDKSAFARLEWLLVLVRNLGNGWFRKSTGRERVHLLQFTASAADIDDLISVFPAAQANAYDLRDSFRDATIADVEKWLKQFKKILVSTEADDPLASAVGTLLEPIPDLSAKETLSNRIDRVRTFFEAWRFVAESFVDDERVAACCAWLEMRVELHKTEKSKDNETADRIIRRLRRLVTAATVDRLAFGTLDMMRDAGSVWSLLDAMGAALKDPTKAEIQALVDTVAVVTQALLEDSTIRTAGSPHVPSTFDSLVKDIGGEFATSFSDGNSDTLPRAHDEGLLLNFDLSALAAGADDDKYLRGYAVALRSGIRQSNAGALLPDDARTTWITGLSVRYNYGTNFSSSTLLRAHDSSIARSQGTVGSALRDGGRIVQFLYRGMPISATAENFDGKPIAEIEEDDFAQLDYRWPRQKNDPLNADFPLLGYGMEYQGLCTAVDNAGGIVARDVRGASRAVVKEAVNLHWPKDSIQYQSLVPPGAPLLIATQFKPSNTDATQFSNQTRALQFINQTARSGTPIGDLVTGNGLPPIVCIVAPSPLYTDDSCTHYSVAAAPPTATRDFARNWLATDECILKSNWDRKSKLKLLSDPFFIDREPEFAEFFETYTGIQWHGGTANPESERTYNPAVNAIGIEFYFGDRWPIERKVVTTDRVKLVTKKLVPVPQDETTVVVQTDVDPNATRPSINPSGRRLQLTLPPGSFARVRFYTLVDSRFFIGEGCNRRFANHIGVQLFSDYRAFGPIERWVEALPQLQAPVNDYLNLRIEPPSPSQPSQMKLRAEPAQALFADWIHSFEVNRHSWHWTGYPVRFPRISDLLERWLPAFSGVESHRNTRTIEIPTQLCGASHEWRLGYSSFRPDGTPSVSQPFQLDEHLLPIGERPSGYAAYTTRPKVRFRKWLRPENDPLLTRLSTPLTLERDIFATGMLIAGVAAQTEARRLPTPNFQFHIPLTASYAYDHQRNDPSLPLNRIDNANLLIFDGAIRRTDTSAHLGGIGDTFEIDLLQTRRMIYPPDSTTPEWTHEFREIGPNPIFHAAPVLDLKKAGDLGQLQIEASEPHGLTFDSVRNAQVAQTAVAVWPVNPTDPRRNVEQWTLAKVRVRRIILPETQLDTVLPADLPLAWRTEGSDRVPMDFVVDYTATKQRVSITLEAKDPDWKYTLDVGSSLPESGPLRLLCSFHKDRWDPSQNGGVPYWAPQVYVQVPRSNALGWETVEKRLPYGQLPVSQAGRVLNITISGTASPSVRIIQLSEYTDPRWLLFIGRVPGTGSIRPDEYLLSPSVSDAGEDRLSLVRGSFGALQGPPKADTDWLAHSPEFYLLLVSPPPASLLAGKIDERDFGLLLFEPVTTVNGTTDFKPLSPLPGGVTLDVLDGCTALLCSFQRITATSAEERGQSIDSMDALLKAIFPENPFESTIRPTPKYWGPMRIGPRTK